MPYSNPEVPDTLLVGTQDLQLLAGVWFDDLWFPYGSGTRRGEVTPTPNKRGRPGTNRKPLDSFTFTLPVTITPHDADGNVADDEILQRAQVLANRRALVTVLLGDGGLIDLTLRESNLAGAFDESTARGDFVTGLNPTGDKPLEIELSLQITNLDGGWWTGSEWLL